MGAQTTSDITPEMEQEMIARSLQYVHSLNKNISYMANKKNSLADRRFTRTSTLTMFIGAGGPYVWVGKDRDGVITQTTSLSNKKPRNHLTQQYFTRLIDMNYPQINITSTQLNQIKASDLKKVGPNQYEVVACFDQEFRATSDGGWMLYGDRTRKKIKVLIELVETIDGTELYVRLGDTTADQTRRI